MKSLTLFVALGTGTTTAAAATTTTTTTVSTAHRPETFPRLPSFFSTTSSSSSSSVWKAPNSPAVDALRLRGGGGDADDGRGELLEKKKKKKKKNEITAVTTEKKEEQTQTQTQTKRDRKKGGKAKKSSRNREEDDGVGDNDVVAEEKEDVKTAINEAMKESDAATALGDAIRRRADILRRDKLPYSERTFDAALVSLGLSLGTAGTDKDDAEDIDDASPEGKVDTAMAYYQYGFRHSLSPHRRTQSHQQRVPPSPSAVIANYFLHTHGGTHALQCLLSLASSALGIACLLLPSFPSPAAGIASSAATAPSLSRRILLSTTKYRLLHQALSLAMAKHASGFVGAVLLGASRIPELGVRNARRYLEGVAMDPVGQYLFYCAFMSVWMGWFGGMVVGDRVGVGMREYTATLRGRVISIANAGAASNAGAAPPSDTVAQLLDLLSQNPPPWYLTHSRGGTIVPILVLAPILLREVLSILWVASDVLALALSSSTSFRPSTVTRLLQTMQSTMRSVLDAVMSVLLTSEKWRNADSFRRQRSLAKLVSRASLLAELCVGGVVLGDAAQAFWRMAFVGPDMGMVNGSGSGSAGARLPFRMVLGKMVCAHLYLHFLLARRKRIETVVSSIRGGAILDRVLDVLMDPRKEMGLEEEEKDDEDD